MADTGFILPNTATDSGASWTNVTNVTLNDGSPATATAVSTTRIQATNYGFSVPAGATINGVEVNVNESMAATGNYTDGTVQLIVGGAAVGTNKGGAYGTLPANGAYATRLYPTSGGPTDLWGNTLAPSDVNASNFGVSVAFSKASAGTAQVDFIQVKVYYTAAASGFVIALK